MRDLDTLFLPFGPLDLPPHTSTPRVMSLIQRAPKFPRHVALILPLVAWVSRCGMSHDCRFVDGKHLALGHVLTLFSLSCGRSGSIGSGSNIDALPISGYMVINSTRHRFQFNHSPLRLLARCSCAWEQTSTLQAQVPKTSH